MVDLGPNIYPKWGKGSVPSVEEWQRLFSLKLDNDRLISELANALSGASSSDMNALLAALIPDVTAGITASGNIVTKTALTNALEGYQPAGSYVAQSALASSLANYATTTSLTSETQRAEAAEETLNSALAAETQRAEGAEARLLPLSGGTLTGNIIGSAGGVVPQVIGASGRVVIQAYSTTITTGQWVPFLQAFSAPPLALLLTCQHSSTDYSTNVINFLYNTVTNTGFQASVTWFVGAPANSGGNIASIPCFVTAIGVS